MSDMKARQSLLVFLLYLEEKYHKNCCLGYTRDSPFVVVRSIKCCLFGLFDQERSMSLVNDKDNTASLHYTAPALAHTGEQKAKSTIG